MVGLHSSIRLSENPLTEEEKLRGVVVPLRPTTGLLFHLENTRNPVVLVCTLQLTESGGQVSFFLVW